MSTKVTLFAAALCGVLAISRFALAPKKTASDAAVANAQVMRGEPINAASAPPAIAAAPPVEPAAPPTTTPPPKPEVIPVKSDAVTEVNNPALEKTSPKAELAKVQPETQAPAKVITSTPTIAATNAPAPASGNEFMSIGFDQLASFTYAMTDELIDTNKSAKAENTPDQIPPSVRALNLQQVSLKGFMLPLKVQGGMVTELLIMRDQSMCCYGTVPKINEWVSVKMVNKGIKPVMDQAVTLYGKLHVGEVRENGYLVGIYQLDGEKMATGTEL